LENSNNSDQQLRHSASSATSINTINNANNANENNANNGDSSRFELILIPRDYVHTRLQEQANNSNNNGNNGSERAVSVVSASVSVSMMGDDTRTIVSGLSGGRTLLGGGGNEEGFGSIVPQNWFFRCDTEEELTIWTHCMKECSPSSFLDFTSSTAIATLQQEIAQQRMDGNYEV